MPILLLPFLLILLGPASVSGAVAAPVGSAVIVPSSATAPADGVTEVTLTATIRDDTGAPIPGLTLRFTTTHPATTITQPLTSTDVLGRAAGSVVSRAQGPAVIGLVDAASGALLASAQVTFLPAPDPAMSSLQIGAATMEASGAVATVPITVTVRDYQGLPLPLRTVRLASADPGDTISQPPLTDTLGRTTGTVSFTGTATVVTAADVGSGVTLGSATLRRPQAAPATGIHAILQPSATRMGNGSYHHQIADPDTITVRLTLLDGQARPLAGKRVALRSSAQFLDTGPPALTDAAGLARFSVRVRPADRHYGTASGPVALAALDLTDGQPLTATTQITVYNRVAVMLQGLATRLSCTPTKCADPLYGQLSADALAPLGYNYDGDGLHRTEIEYSYRGGSMVRLANGTWQWLIARYGTCDTVQPLERSAQALRDLLQSYHARYPYTTFEIIGHSLGGLVALYALGNDGGAFVRRLGPAALDKVLLADSPLNGIGDPHRLAVIADLLGGFGALHSCSGQRFGADLVLRMLQMGRQAPRLQERWVAAVHGAGGEVLDVTNRDDRLIPESLAIIDDGRAQHASDRIRYALGSRDGLGGHGTVLFRHRDNRLPNPAWPGFVSLLQGYLTNPCTALAAPGASCPYPSINLGF